MKTRERVIRQEVLLAPGEAWDARKVEESERNLRRLFILTVSRIVPLKGTQGGIALLVVTKDRWSIRLNSEFNLVGSLLQYLRLRPTEQNFLGQNQQLSVDFILRLDTVSVGQFFQERRLFGSRLYFGEYANLMFNRVTGKLEGSQGSVMFGRPLISLDQRWGAVALGDWSVRRRRVFQGPRVLQLDYPDEDAPTSKVPAEWNAREGQGEVQGTLRFGERYKTDLTLALGAYTRQYAPPSDLGLSAEEAQWLQDTWLPTSETASYVQATVAFFAADYAVLRNRDTFELSEDVQLGPSLKLSARWAAPPPLSTRHFLEVGATARYRLLALGNLLTVGAGGQVRFTAGAEPANETVAVEVRNDSPAFWGGRFVARGVAQWRWNDLNQRRVLLGGGNGLRGAAPEVQVGRHYLLGNVEYRSRTFELRTIFVGLVLFWDFGSAFTEAPQLVHTVGAGLRILLPQFDSMPIRIDFGMVLGGDRPSPDRIAASFGQVTDLRPDQLDEPL